MATFNYALIMAAGRGMRMMPLTMNVPKPMAILNGSTLISSAINTINKHIPTINITVGYKGAMLAKHVIKEGVSAVFNTEGKGNAWWIYNTLMKFVDEPVLVLTCDNVVELDYELIAHDYKKLGNPACMVVPVKPVEGLDGDFIFHDKNRVLELNRNKPSEIYCSGIQVLNPAKINSITSSTDNFYEVWNQLIQAQQLYCSNIYPNKWYAVDTLEQLNALNNVQDNQE